MPITYINIGSTTLGSVQTTVTFSGIPSTYTDLVLRVSTRSTGNQTSQDLYVTFNSTTTDYSHTFLLGNGGSASSSRSTTTPAFMVKDGTPAATATANTFSNVEIYIPSYLASANKPMSAFAINEQNNATAWISSTAGLWRNTAAISSISISPDSNQFAAGSTFYLYGIKNN